MKNIFVLRIIKTIYPHKDNWDDLDNYDVKNMRFKDSIFFANTYEEVIEKFFETEKTKEITTHGELIQTWIDIADEPEKYGLEEFVDYVDYKNSYDKYDFSMTGFISVLNTDTEFNLPIEISFERIMSEIVNNEYSTQYTGEFHLVTFNSDEEVKLYEQFKCGGPCRTWMSFESRTHTIQTFPTQVFCKFVYHEYSDDYTAIYLSKEMVKEELTILMNKLTT